MLELYVGLTNYCNAQESFDRGMFAVMLDTYTSGYKRLDYQEQGELAEDIRKHYKEYEWRTEMGTEVSKKVMEELLDLSAGAEEVESGLTDLLVKQDLNRKVEALNTIYNRWLKLRGEIKKAERPDQVFVDKDGKETSTHSRKAFDGLKALREKAGKLERIFHKALKEDDYGEAFNVAKDKGDGGSESKETDSGGAA